jgi:hypothetical protein
MQISISLIPVAERKESKQLSTSLCFPSECGSRLLAVGITTPTFGLPAMFQWIEFNPFIDEGIDVPPSPVEFMYST